MLDSIIDILPYDDRFKRSFLAPSENTPVRVKEIEHSLGNPDNTNVLSFVITYHESVKNFAYNILYVYLTRRYDKTPFLGIPLVLQSCVSPLQEHIRAFIFAFVEYSYTLLYCKLVHNSPCNPYSISQSTNMNVNILFWDNLFVEKANALLKSLADIDDNIAKKISNRKTGTFFANLKDFLDIIDFSFDNYEKEERQQLLEFINELNKQPLDIKNFLLKNTNFNAVCLSDEYFESISDRHAITMVLHPPYNEEQILSLFSWVNKQEQDQEQILLYMNTICSNTVLSGVTDYHIDNEPAQFPLVCWNNFKYAQHTLQKENTISKIATLHYNYIDHDYYRKKVAYDMYMRELDSSVKTPVIFTNKPFGSDKIMTYHKKEPSKQVEIVTENDVGNSVGEYLINSFKALFLNLDSETSIHRTSNPFQEQVYFLLTSDRRYNFEEIVNTYKGADIGKFFYYGLYNAYYRYISEEHKPSKDIQDFIISLTSLDNINNTTEYPFVFSAPIFNLQHNITIADIQVLIRACNIHYDSPFLKNIQNIYIIPQTTPLFWLPNEMLCSVFIYNNENEIIKCTLPFETVVQNVPFDSLDIQRVSIGYNMHIYNGVKNEIETMQNTTTLLNLESFASSNTYKKNKNFASHYLQKNASFTHWDDSLYIDLFSRKKTPLG